MLFNIIKNAGVYCPGAKTCRFQNPVYFHYNILYKLSYSQQHLALLKYKFMIFWWHTTETILIKFTLLRQTVFTYTHLLTGSCITGMYAMFCCDQATYWVHYLPNIKGSSGHCWQSILIFANGASYAWSIKNLNAQVQVCGLV